MVHWSTALVTLASAAVSLWQLCSASSLLNGDKFLCLFHCGDLPVVGAPPVAWYDRLVVTVEHRVFSMSERGWSGVSGHNTRPQGTWIDATFWL